MKKNTKYILIFLILIVVLISILLILGIKHHHAIKEGEEEKVTFIKDNYIKDDNETLVFNIENKLEEQEVIENVKDAATLTNEIYSINGPIGHLYIPKTGLDTDIFSNQTVEKMEEMPCFLYTTGGLNKVGITLFTGHNRVNGTLFSNNSKLEVGDEFYFKDLEGTELKYTIYSKTIKLDTDTAFLQDEVDKPIIALSCCTDNNDEYRIVILGQAEV